MSSFELESEDESVQRCRTDLIQAGTVLDAPYSMHEALPEKNRLDKSIAEEPNRCRDAGLISYKQAQFWMHLILCTKHCLKRIDWTGASQKSIASCRKEYHCFMSR
jgi:hypothetical protein